MARPPDIGVHLGPFAYQQVVGGEVQVTFNPPQEFEVFIPLQISPNPDGPANGGGILLRHDGNPPDPDARLT